ncbi:solute carrier family 15 member 4-like [Babylonia areolata]|uniref:solute carrier family 15 member 4-like n=1 Tax=Babylonia areolata TaxID=304850 RepID=UPI003FD4DBF7
MDASSTKMRDNPAFIAGDENNENDNDNSNTFSASGKAAAGRTAASVATAAVTANGEACASSSSPPDENDVSPKSQMTTKKLLVVVCILLTEMGERLTYYSVVANLALYCTSVLLFDSTTAANVTTIFSGVVYLMPVIGGIISDAWAGKFRTIVASGFIYILGLVLLPASAFSYTSVFGTDEDGSYFDMNVDTRRALFLSSLVFIAIGTGGIKSNVGPFGAQQLQEQGEAAVKSFFNWFYWFINVGSLIAYTGVAYVQQEVSFAWGYVVPLVSMVIAIFLFIVVRPFYEHKAPGGSLLSMSVAVVWQVLTRKRPEVPPGEKSRFFDPARARYGGSFDDHTVESVKAVLRVLPVFLTIVMYWAVYNQMSTTFLFQGERLDVSVGSIQIPASGLNAFNTIIIIILIPIVDRGLYPCMEKIGRPLSHLQRIGIGFVLASLSMVVAGVVEIARKDRMEEPGGTLIQDLGGEKFNASSMSVFVQVPQFALVGASEVFASICGLEFAYTQAPKSMQGVLMGLFLVTSGLGGFIATGILNAVQAATKDNPWFDDEINNAHVQYYFFLFGGLMFLDFLVFLIIAKFYRYRSTKYDELPDMEIEVEPAKSDVVGCENTHL